MFSPSAVQSLPPLKAAYDFPVSLQPMFTKAGKEIPNLKAVIREDTDMPIAAVSNRYNLVSHTTVVTEAQQFIHQFGTPQEEYFLGRNGAVMVAQFTYKEHQVEVAKGDVVGLRVYVENSYNSQRSVRVRIGALVLSCMNGMVSDKGLFNFSFRHVGSETIKFPDPDEVLMTFNQETKFWQMLGDVRGKKPSAFEPLFMGAISRGLLTNQQNKALAERYPAPETLWDFNQAITYATTHMTPKLSPIGRLTRLERLAKWMSEVGNHPHIFDLDTN